MQTKKENRTYEWLVIIALAIATIAQSYQIGQLMIQNNYQQEINIELNEKISELTFDR